MKSQCLIIAGEKSGEEQGMTFLPKLQEQFPEVSFFGVGGDEFKRVGVDCLYDLKDFSTMGFSEAIEKLPFYYKAFYHLLEEAKKRQARYAILIDNQDFNLRMAIKLKLLGVKVFYYIAPQAWGWKPHRATKLAQSVQTLFCLLPFEKKWFMDRGVKQAVGVVHPVHQRFSTYLPKILERKWTDEKNHKPKILLLPGSRKSEVSRLLPIMLETISLIKKHYPLAEIGIVRAKTIPESWIKAGSEEIDHFFTDDNIAEALLWADFCYAASGTVTLICGYFKIPTVVIYQASLLNEFIFYHLVKYKGLISLTNIILGFKLFPERVQKQVNAHILWSDFKSCMQPETYQKTLDQLQTLPTSLQGEVTNVADYIAQEWRKT
jgi:lipid-A-disaccharide synthase